MKSPKASPGSVQQSVDLLLEGGGAQTEPHRLVQQTSACRTGQSGNRLLARRHTRRRINTTAICLRSRRLPGGPELLSQDSTVKIEAPDGSMASQRSLLLCLCIALAVGLQLAQAQHWSHGWYPGGKRDVRLPQSPEVSEDIKLCDGEDCAYLTIPREKIVKTLLADLLAGQLRKKK